MSGSAAFDAWSAGNSYEHYMGRWSRLVATKFVAWLAPPGQAAWLEIGCGTGALTAAVLSAAAPRSIVSIDPSVDFVAHVRKAIGDGRARFEVADALKLPAEPASIDVVTSGLVLNFVPDRPAALAEMQRVLKPGGLLSFYVWDYPGGGIGFIRQFWQAAITIDPAAAELGEGRRFPFCTREGLLALCQDAGLRDIAIAPMEIETRFADFEAFWQPFTLGAGPAPGYCMSLNEYQRAKLKARLAERLGSTGPIELVARAWMVKAKTPG
ncbi:SAM-dependent methyltransferase [Aminobacter lissarensis]|uniref:SAM-dependent methyltransferase n=1 Tax=Aminobacter carboxidus TaxID=376165 RepID=A0A8E2BE29_9HYPH|nr:class I SAM-dependent methyltransferase [Aminobacter lissarensis]MBB6469311.1 SAM-dependent methyltransferase [Aminobacter lissarensis]